MDRPGPEHDIAAVQALCGELGLGPIEPVVMRLARHTVVRLGALPLVARVQSTGPLALARETMARELAVVQHLVREGAPVVPPSRDPPPGVYELGGCVISLWPYVEHRPGEARDAAAAAAALKRVHAGLASYPGALPPFAVAIASCQTLLDDPQALRTVPPADRSFLAERYLQALDAIPWARLRPIALHGDTQFGNLFMTEHGPLWGDFEAACAGPLEWDLVDKPLGDVRRVPGSRPGADGQPVHPASGLPGDLVLGRRRAQFGGERGRSVSSAAAASRSLAMPPLYPPIDPYETGRLDVGDGQDLYWETCGSPEGRSALVLHGGPGSGCTPGARRFFDPSAFRIVLFDQRGCGRSLPHASDPAVSLAANTTAHQIADIEALRRRLGVERWLVFGSSWGSVLGLAYAQQYPQHVSALVLSHASAGRPSDIHWLYHGVGRYFPEAWDRFRSAAGVGEPDANLIQAYHRLLSNSDPQVREKAARDWCDWEAAVISIDPGHKPPERYLDPRFRMVFARIVTHYFSHYCWLKGDELLDGAHRLAGIPGAIVLGRLDLGTPLEGPWKLAQAWPGAELIIIDEAGHETTTPGMLESIVAAIDRFAGGV